MTLDPIIEMRHVREAKMCSRGLRMWMARSGLDYNHFLTHGYPCSVIEAKGDSLGLAVAAIARKEAEEGATS